MRALSYLLLLLGLTCLLTGCPALSGLGGNKGGGGTGGSEDGGGGKDQREKHDDDDESAIPRLQWYATHYGEAIPMKQDGA
jgi:hypothetical protein